jgi:hypothetical protein
MWEMSLRLMGMSSLQAKKRRNAFRQAGKLELEFTVLGMELLQVSWQRHASQVAKIPYQSRVVAASFLLLVVFIADRGTTQLNPDPGSHPHLKYLFSFSITAPPSLCKSPCIYMPASSMYPNLKPPCN